MSDDRVAALEAEISGLDPATTAVRDVIDASRELTGRMARRMEMNANDMAALGLLGVHGPMGAAELARRLGISSASVTVMVDRLERAGHAERVRDTTDRRRVVLTHTDDARRTSLEAWLPVIRGIDEVCRSLSDDDRAVALDFLRRITAAIDRGGTGTA